MTGAISIGTLARVAVLNVRNADAPMRRCADCRLNLDPGFTMRALGTCPLFGYSRHGAELRCRNFVERGTSASPHG